MVCGGSEQAHGGWLKRMTWGASGPVCETLQASPLLPADSGAEASPCSVRLHPLLPHAWRTCEWPSPRLLLAPRAAGAAALLGPASPQGRHPKSLAPSRQLLGSCLDILEELLTSSFPVPVPVPSYSLLLLANRALGMDAGRVVASGRVPPSASLWAELQAMLPALHTAALLLVQLLCRAARGQLLTLHGLITSTLAQQLRALRLGAPGSLLTQPPAVRSALYQATAEFVRLAGFGVLRQLACEAIGAAAAEVYGSGTVAGMVQDGSKGGSEGHRAKKQKLSIDGMGADLEAAAAAAAAGAGASAGDLAVQAAALQMLETLVQVGGAGWCRLGVGFAITWSCHACEPAPLHGWPRWPLLAELACLHHATRLSWTQAGTACSGRTTWGADLGAHAAPAAPATWSSHVAACYMVKPCSPPPSYSRLQVGGPALPSEMRAQVDSLAAHVAGSCAAAALKLQQDPHQAKAGSIALRGLQLSSLQLLLASVLSPVPHRPPFLAQALQLFQAARWVRVCGVVVCKWSCACGSISLCDAASCVTPHLACCQLCAQPGD